MLTVGAPSHLWNCVALCLEVETCLVPRDVLRGSDTYGMEGPLLCVVARLVMPAKNGQNCPSVPAHPSNANISANIATASSRNPVNGGVNPQSASYVSPASTLAWFNAQVKYGGPWDYKIQGSQFEDFGNFNYGATGVAAGFDASTLLRAAGYAQRHPAISPIPGRSRKPAEHSFQSKGWDAALRR